MGPEERALLTVVDAGDFVLRHKQRGDAIDDYAWRRDPETTALDGSGQLSMGFSEFLAWFEAYVLGGLGGRTWLALEAADGTFFGNVACFNVDHARLVAEVGVSIGRPDYRGRGFGTAALVSFVRHLWSTTPFRLLELHVFEWNERARASFRRAGFEEVARVVQGKREVIRMQARREWWLLWDSEGRFARERPRPAVDGAAPA